MSPRNALLVTLVLAAVAIGLAYSKPWSGENDRSGAAAADLLIASEPGGAGQAGSSPTQPIPLFDPTMYSGICSVVVVCAWVVSTGSFASLA